MTVGWLAFDERTRKQLRVIEANGVDRFGEPLIVSVRREPVLEALRARPPRISQIERRLGVRREPLEMMLAGLVARGAVLRDEEGFYAAVSA